MREMTKKNKKHQNTKILWQLLTFFFMVIKEQNLRIIIIFKGNANNIYLSSKKSISNDYKKKRKQKISLNESISSKCKFTSNT